MTIVRVTSGGIPVTESATGYPYYEADNGFGIPVTFGSTGIPLGGASNRLKLANPSTDLIYVTQPQSFGATAVRMQKNIGDVAVTNGSVGPPNEVYRATADYELLTPESDPTSPVSTFSSDTGAQDYAMQESTTLLAGGSYHGGETVISEVWTINGVVVDPANGPFHGNVIKLTRTSLVTYIIGKTMSVTYEITFNPSGTVTDTIVMSSTAAFAGTQAVPMKIASTAFTQAYANGTWFDTSVAQDHALGTANDVTLRDPTTGRTMRVVTDAPQQSGYSSTFVRVDVNRAKLYFMFASTAGAALGTRTVNRTISYGKDSLSVYVEDFNGASKPAAWTVNLTSGTNQPVWSGGKMTWTRTATGTDDTRIVRTIPFTHEVGATYRVTSLDFAIVGASPSAGVTFGLFNTGTGSTSSPLAGVTFQGINLFTFPLTYVATQATHYVLFRQQGGTAAQTCAIDKILIEKV
jgi:hypothetical protein